MEFFGQLRVSFDKSSHDRSMDRVIVYLLSLRLTSAPSCQKYLQFILLHEDVLILFDFYRVLLFLNEFVFLVFAEVLASKFSLSIKILNLFLCRCFRFPAYVKQDKNFQSLSTNCSELDKLELRIPKDLIDGLLIQDEIALSVCTPMPCKVNKEKNFFFDLNVVLTIQKVWLVSFILYVPPQKSFFCVS